ncbi:MAG TPA: hypothetical protein VFU69_10940 [Ktedonobacterales bacterium]|nr:hypothetical protein [Ktedonobacterales bacterium]
MPGGLKTGEDRRQALFIPPAASALKVSLNAAAQGVELAANRRCEPFD